MFSIDIENNELLDKCLFAKYFTQCLMLDARCSKLDALSSKLDARCSPLAIDHFQIQFQHLLQFRFFIGIE